MRCKACNIVIKYSQRTVETGEGSSVVVDEDLCTNCRGLAFDKGGITSLKDRWGNYQMTMADWLDSLGINVPSETKWKNNNGESN